MARELSVGVLGSRMALSSLPDSIGLISDGYGSLLGRTSAYDFSPSRPSNHDTASRIFDRYHRQPALRAEQAEKLQADALSLLSHKRAPSRQPQPRQKHDGNARPAGATKTGHSSLPLPPPRAAPQPEPHRQSIPSRPLPEPRDVMLPSRPHVPPPRSTAAESAAGVSRGSLVTSNRSPAAATPKHKTQLAPAAPKGAGACAAATSVARSAARTTSASAVAPTPVASSAAPAAAAGSPRPVHPPKWRRPDDPPIASIMAFVRHCHRLPHPHLPPTPSPTALPTPAAAHLPPAQPLPNPAAALAASPSLPSQAGAGSLLPTSAGGTDEQPRRRGSARCGACPGCARGECGACAGCRLKKRWGGPGGKGCEIRACEEMTRARGEARAASRRLRASSFSNEDAIEAARRSGVCEHSPECSHGFRRGDRGGNCKLPTCESKLGKSWERSKVVSAAGEAEEVLQGPRVAAGAATGKAQPPKAAGGAFADPAGGRNQMRAGPRGAESRGAISRPSDAQPAQDALVGRNGQSCGAQEGGDGLSCLHPSPPMPLAAAPPVRRAAQTASAAVRRIAIADSDTSEDDSSGGGAVEGASSEGAGSEGGVNGLGPEVHGVNGAGGVSDDGGVNNLAADDGVNDLFGTVDGATDVRCEFTTPAGPVAPICAGLTASRTATIPPGEDSTPSVADVMRFVRFCHVKGVPHLAPHPPAQPARSLPHPVSHPPAPNPPLPFPPRSPAVTLATTRSVPAPTRVAPGASATRGAPTSTTCDEEKQRPPPQPPPPPQQRPLPPPRRPPLPLPGAHAPQPQQKDRPDAPNPSRKRAAVEPAGVARPPAKRRLPTPRALPRPRNRKGAASKFIL